MGERITKYVPVNITAEMKDRIDALRAEWEDATGVRTTFVSFMDLILAAASPVINQRTAAIKAALGEEAA